MLRNHCCAYMQYKCRVFKALSVMPDVHSSSLHSSVRVSHAVQLFMGFAHWVFGSPCCAQLLLMSQDNKCLKASKYLPSAYMERS